MKLVPLQEFSRTRFSPGGAPHPNTLRRMVKDKDLPGLHLGSRYYIDLDALEAGYTRPEPVKLAAISNQSEEDIVAKVLRDVRRSS